jgi:hypothetical protein
MNQSFGLNFIEIIFRKDYPSQLEVLCAIFHQSFSLEAQV